MKTKDLFKQRGVQGTVELFADMFDQYLESAGKEINDKGEIVDKAKVQEVDSGQGSTSN